MLSRGGSRKSAALASVHSDVCIPMDLLCKGYFMRTKRRRVLRYPAWYNSRAENDELHGLFETSAGDSSILVELCYIEGLTKFIAVGLLTCVCSAAGSTVLSLPCRS